MKMQLVLKVLSGLCLIYVAFNLLAFSFTVLINGVDSAQSAAIITLAAFPGIAAFVTAYRQFFAPVRGLILLVLVLIALMNIVIFVGYKWLLASSEGVLHVAEALSPASPTVWDFLKAIGVLYLAMTIPVYVSFRPRK